MHGDAAPVATAIDRTPFPWLQVAVKLGIIAGFTSVMLVLLLGQSRVFLAMAEDGMVPALFARLHPTRQTPYWSNLLFMAMTGALAAFVPVEVLGHMTSIGTLLAFAIVCAGVLVLRWREPERKRAFRVPGSPAVPLLGIATCLLMMVSLGWASWARLVAWLVVGLVIYAGYGHRRARLVREGG